MIALDVVKPHLCTCLSLIILIGLNLIKRIRLLLFLGGLILTIRAVLFGLGDFS
jgi:hypothetical protein